MTEALHRLDLTIRGLLHPAAYDIRVPKIPILQANRFYLRDTRAHEKFRPDPLDSRLRLLEFGSTLQPF